MKLALKSQVELEIASYLQSACECSLACGIRACMTVIGLGTGMAACARGMRACAQAIYVQHHHGHGRGTASIDIRIREFVNVNNG